jgi:hypothetical protein
MSRSSVVTETPGRGEAWAVATALATLAWTAWLYRMPAVHLCSWGVNPEGVAHFSHVLHLTVGAAAPAVFDAGFRVGVGAAFLAYLGLLATGLAGAELSVRRLAGLAGATAVLLAVAGPPGLSPDIYSYVGYARLQVIHHLNPYVATQLELARLGDPTGPFLRWPISSPYGPLWTLVSMAAVAVSPRASIWPALVLLKLVSAAALLAMAEGGRRLAERRAPGRGPLVFAALAFNPLFLVEGVVNGHSDVVMAALVVWTLVMAAERRFTRAFALLGLAISVKFVPLLLLPWLLVAVARAAPPGRRLAVAARGLGTALAPLVASFAVFWQGGRTLGGLRSRSDLGQQMAGRDPRVVAVAVAVVYAVLTAWVLRRQAEPLLERPEHPFDERLPGDRLDIGWVVMSFAVGSLASGVVFPWYVVWPLSVSLIRVDKRSLVLSAMLCGLAVAKMLKYT